MLSLEGDIGRVRDSLPKPSPGNRFDSLRQRSPADADTQATEHLIRITPVPVLARRRRALAGIDERERWSHSILFNSLTPIYSAIAGCRIQSRVLCLFLFERLCRNDSDLVSDIRARLAFESGAGLVKPNAFKLEDGSNVHACGRRNQFRFAKAGQPLMVAIEATS